MASNGLIGKFIPIEGYVDAFPGVPTKGLEDSFKWRVGGRLFRRPYEGIGRTSFIEAGGRLSRLLYDGNGYSYHLTSLTTFDVSRFGRLSNLRPLQERSFAVGRIASSDRCVRIWFVT